MITASLSMTNTLTRSQFGSLMSDFRGDITTSSLISSDRFAAFGFQLSAGMSEFVVSLPLLSNPHTIFMQSDDIARVNFGNLRSATSHASAGFQFKDIFAIYGSDISSFPAFHFANSTLSDINITVALTQFSYLSVLIPDPLNSLNLIYYEPWDPVDSCFAAFVSNGGFEDGTAGWLGIETGFFTSISTVYGIDAPVPSFQAVLATFGEGYTGNGASANSFLSTNFLTVYSGDNVSGAHGPTTVMRQLLSATENVSSVLTFRWNMLVGITAASAYANDAAYFTINYTNGATPDIIEILASSVSTSVDGGIGLTNIPIAQDPVGPLPSFILHTQYAIYTTASFVPTYSIVTLGFGITNKVNTGLQWHPAAGLMIDGVVMSCAPVEA